MKLIATVNKPEEAHLLRAHLEGSGVAAYVRDDLTIGVDWAVANAIGGIKVEVADEDYDQAVAIMRSGAVPPAAPQAGKAHGVGRYFVIFLVTTVLVFGAFVIPPNIASRLAIGIAVLPSVAVGLAVAFLCAVFDV